MTIKRVGVLTSGGDASGMNAAVRAVVRTGLDRGLEVYGIYEGYAGLIEGGDRIRPMTWNSVGGIIHRGGTIIGTARSEEFRTREGRLAAARNLLARRHRQPDRHRRRRQPARAPTSSAREWSGLLDELVAKGAVLGRDVAARHPRLLVVGLVGSIDNDAVGTDMTIGADTALHRITEAIDAISSTASSHRRTFVVEVMGRHCGYLALMSAHRHRRRLGVHPRAPAGGRRLGGGDDRRAQGRPRGRPPRRHRHRRRGRDRPARPADHQRAPAAASSRRGSPSRFASRCSATCSAAARRAPSTATSAPSWGTGRSTRSCRAAPTRTRRSSACAATASRTCRSPSACRRRARSTRCSNRRSTRGRSSCGPAASPRRCGPSRRCSAPSPTRRSPASAASASPS